MKDEVEREVGELAKLRLFYERVMALPRERILDADDYHWKQVVYAADIDEALKEAE